MTLFLRVKALWWRYPVMRRWRLTLERSHVWAGPGRPKVGRDGDDRGRRSQAEEGRALLLLEVQTWQTGRLNRATDLYLFYFLQTFSPLRFPKIVYFHHALYLLRLLTTHSMPSRTPSPLVALQAWICHSRSWRWWWPWCFVIEMWIKRSRMMIGNSVLYPLRVQKYT